MSLEVYDRGALFLDGTCLAEWTDGTVDFKGNFTAVETMARGGSIRGFVRDEARGMDVNFTQRIRRDGTEFSPTLHQWLDGETVSIGVRIGGEWVVSEGKINLGTLSMKDGTQEVTFVGAAPEVLTI